MGLWPIVGVVGARISVTGICWDVRVWPWLESVMAPLYVLLDSPVMSTLTVTTICSVVVVPEVGLRVSQEALSFSVQFSVPPPLFVIVNV